MTGTRNFSSTGATHGMSLWTLVKTIINLAYRANSCLQGFLPGQWAKVVRHAHIELTNADVTFATWMKGLLLLIAPWSLSERKRALALATSNKVS